MAKSNYNEYTRLRDIAHKRAARLEKAGLAPAVRIPTVADIRAGRVSESEAMQAVKNYLSGGSTVKAAKQTGLVPEFKQFNLPAEQKKRSRLTPEERRERKRESDRRYRIRKALRDGATGEQATKRQGYLKALQTVANRWASAGFDLGIDLKRLTPAQARAFVAYMDYRFSQGDFTQHYVINDFIQDFSKLLQKGHRAQDITSDFDKFLADQNRLQENADKMEGLTLAESESLWNKFINED